MSSTPSYPEPFRCEVERDAGRVAVRPIGELDIATVPEVESALRGVHEEGAKSIVLDLRGVEFLDSSGLRLILAWNEASRRDGFAFRLVQGPDAVQRVLEATRVVDHLDFVPPAG